MLRVEHARFDLRKALASSVLPGQREDYRRDIGGEYPSCGSNSGGDRQGLIARPSREIKHRHSCADLCRV